MHSYEQFLLKIMGAPFQGKYQHHHVFPNLLVTHTDSLTLFQVVRATGSTTASSNVWQFSRQSLRKNPFSRLTAAMWARVTAWLSHQVLKEDLQIFQHVQRGEQVATEHSIFGRCEERLFAFQKFLTELMQMGDSPRTSCNTVGAETPLEHFIDTPISEQK